MDILTRGECEQANHVASVIPRVTHINLFDRGKRCNEVARGCLAVRPAVTEDRTTLLDGTPHVLLVAVPRGVQLVEVEYKRGFHLYVRLPFPRDHVKYSLFGCPVAGRDG